MPRPVHANGRPGTPVVDTVAYRDQRERMTTAFISTAPVTISLIPRTKVDKPAGGFAWNEQASRAPQVFRIGDPTDPPQVVQGSDGIQRQADLTLVGEPDAVIAVTDVFDLGGHRFEVAQLLFRNGFETRAEVVRLG